MEKKERTKLNYQIHSFKTSDNITLNALLTQPSKQSKENNQTIILHIHGMCGDLLSNIGQLVAETAHKNKLPTFLINTRGHGIVSSFKQKDKLGNSKYFTAGTAYEVFEDSELDIQGAIDYLKTQGYKKIILSGHSTGCQKIINYQLNNQKKKTVKALIMLAPGDDLNIEKRDNDKFSDTLKLAKQKINTKVLFHTEDFSLLSAKRFYNLFKKTSIEGNLFNYTKKLDYLKKVKIPILSLIGSEDPYFLDNQKAVNNLEKNILNKFSCSKLINGNHSFYKQENNLKKEIGLFLKTIL